LIENVSNADISIVERR